MRIQCSEDTYISVMSLRLSKELISEEGLVALSLLFFPDTRRPFQRQSVVAVAMLFSLLLGVVFS